MSEDITLQTLCQALVLYNRKDMRYPSGVMTTTRSTKDKPRPYGDTRPQKELTRMESFRFRQSISEMLQRATHSFDCTKTYYVELALSNQFQKDGIQ